MAIKEVAQFNGYPIKDKTSREGLLLKADKTQIDELLELIENINTMIGNLPDNAKELPFDDTKSLIGALNVQDAIDLLKNMIATATGTSADGVSYNFESLDVGTVKEALDHILTELTETVLLLDDINSSKVKYNPNNSGLEVGTVQLAIDKLKILIDALDLLYDNMNKEITTLKSRTNDTDIRKTAIGKWGSSWNLASDYKNIGSNSETYREVNNEFFKTISGENAYIQVKKSGLYLVNGYVCALGSTTTTGGCVYGRVTINDNTITQEEHAVCQYVYGTNRQKAHFSFVQWLNANDILKLEISSHSTGVLRCDGCDVLTVTKL